MKILEAEGKGHRYVINQLHMNFVYRDQFMVTKAAVDSFESGRDLGLLIESRGERDARWSWVGQVSLDHPLNLSTGSQMRLADIERLFGRKMGQPIGDAS